MTCREFQEQLFDSFGQGELPAELQAHLETCAACRRVQSELNGAAGHLGDNELFAPVGDEVDGLLAAIDKQLDAATVVIPRWRTTVLRFAPVAAAVVLLLGIGLISQRSTVHEMAAIDTSSTIDEYALLDNADLTYTNADESLDEGTIDVLLDDYTSVNRVEPSRTLLDDLTEDELEYLTTNFDIGEIL